MFSRGPSVGFGEKTRRLLLAMLAPDAFRIGSAGGATGDKAEGKRNASREIGACFLLKNLDGVFDE